MKSRIGITLALIYLVIAVTLDIYALTCTQMLCWVVVLFTTMPWSSFDLLSPQNVLNPFLFQIVNAVIIYFIGFLISKTLLHLKK